MAGATGTTWRWAHLLGRMRNHRGPGLALDSTPQNSMSHAVSSAVNISGMTYS